MPSHPMRSKIEEPTKNRLKRTSFNHLSRKINRANISILPQTSDHREPLRNFDTPPDCLDDVTINLEVPGLEKKQLCTTQELKTVTLEMMRSRYNKNEWAHVFTDGS